MYCRPAFVYVTGNPVVGPGNGISATTAPVFLSHARRTGVAPPSPPNKSVLVTSSPVPLVFAPVLGISTPCSFGFFLIASGVLPCGTDQRRLPVFRSTASTCPYGGLRSGRPNTDVHASCAWPRAS